MSMENRLTQSQLHILQHTRGLDQHGCGTWYRNHFCASPGHGDWDDLKALESLGLMKEGRRPNELTGGDYVFYVTEAGDAAIKQQSPPPPRLSPAKQRYRDWLDADTSTPFIEWVTLRTQDQKASRA